jgi:hypothetical protein
MQPVIKPVVVSDPTPDASAFDSRRSVPNPTPDVDVTQQQSRHVSASVPHDTIPNAPPIITMNFADPPGTAPLSSPAKTSPPRNSAITSVAGLHTQDQGQDSPVMNETLSVIQEHISDMNTPRNSVRDRRSANDSGSEYSSHLDHRLSYINGSETDEEEEENAMHEEEVTQWSPDQVAEYLASVGVEERHCQVFRDQEITGDVLLGMDQASIMLPQFELGPLGRRLKIWQRVKALQDEILGGTPAATRRTSRSNTQYSSEVGSEDTGSRSRSRSQTTTSALPSFSSGLERLGSRPTNRYSQQQQTGRSNSLQTTSPSKSHAQDRTSTMQERSNTIDSPTRPSAGEKRPSAASIRDLNHSRRFSSVDYGSNMIDNSLSKPGSNSPTKSGEKSHKKGTSFDKNWTMGYGSPSTPTRPLSASGDKLMSTEEEDSMAASGVTVTTPWEFDRGYFSGGEAESRARNVLRKRGSATHTLTHSRNSSYTDEQRIRSATTNSRHSRFGSVDSIREPHISPAGQKYYGMSSGRRKNSSNDTVNRPMVPAKDVPSPTVTKLDGSSSFRGSDSPRSPDQLHTPDWVQSGNQVASPRGTIPLRAASEAVTGNERARMTTAGTSSPVKEDTVQSPSVAGSSTSGGPSFEIDSPKTSESLSTMTTPASKTSRRKAKKETSAYTRGLEKKTPQEMMIGADYSGWMKKKSTNLMTTWKPRLFILKGRRLSYFYSEDDTEEKGLIDISFHRVLPADNDRLTGLHATLTGATTSPTSPQNSHTPTIASQEAAAEPVSTLSKAEGDSMFIFKLVPPRAGLSRAVNFTKPTVHYFAVPNITLGRLWMAALMKATIDRDDSKPITTTYQQKTISLAKARAMRHRPPALMNLDEKVEDETVKTPAPDLTGLNIRGIIFDQDNTEGDSGISGVSKSGGVKPEIGLSHPAPLKTTAENGLPPSYQAQLPQTA